MALVIFPLPFLPFALCPLPFALRSRCCPPLRYWSESQPHGDAVSEPGAAGQLEGRHDELQYAVGTGQRTCSRRTPASVLRRGVARRTVRGRQGHLPIGDKQKVPLACGSRDHMERSKHTHGQRAVGHCDRCWREREVCIRDHAHTLRLDHVGSARRAVHEPQFSVVCGLGRGATADERAATAGTCSSASESTRSSRRPGDTRWPSGASPATSTDEAKAKRSRGVPRFEIHGGDRRFSALVTGQRGQRIEDRAFTHAKRQLSRSGGRRRWLPVSQHALPLQLNDGFICCRADDLA